MRKRDCEEERPKRKREREKGREIVRKRDLRERERE